jgi:thiamine-phosphate pyrophosphorylase
MTLSGIYAIIDRAATRDPFPLLAAVLSAGVRLVQYRAKAGVDRGVVARMLERTRAAGALLIVNDDLEAALQADGLHVGQEDLAAHDAGALRRRLGARILGISCGTAAEAQRAREVGADYVGAGPFAATETKRDAGPAIGEAGVRAMVAAACVPVAAIGGIGLGNLAVVADTGAAMAAVISAVAEATDPRAAAAALVREWARLNAGEPA